MRPAAWSCLAAALTLASCDCGQPVEIGGTGGGSLGAGGGATGGNGGGGGTDGTGGSAGSGGSSTGGGGGQFFDPDSGCAAVSSNAMIGSKPVDIVMVIDNSCSMTEEITGVQSNINSSFANILTDGGLDYRVILVSKNGSATADQSICITAPLSGNASCSPPPAAPVNTARFFQYDTEISSTNELSKLLSTYSTADVHNFAPMGWRQWLRSDAFRVVLVITDDNSSVSPAAFEGGLFGLSPPAFGTDAGTRNYRFHSIIGVAQKANPADAYQASEPIVTSKCSTAVNPGSNYQPLSRATGGLRFPLCDPSKYGTVFETIAQGVIAGARVACDFTIPPPPPGFTTFNRVIVNYTPMGNGTVQSFTKVMNLAACGAANYYVDNGRIVLCPQVCTTVQADAQARVDVIFTCEPEIN